MSYIQTEKAVESRKSRRESRKVAYATLVGTTIEWYDFFIYGSAAGLVFRHLFFAPAGAQLGTMLAFATVGISFLFRPLGAFIAGHFGDRIGRRTILVTTLILMGVATTLIGLLPTYESIGISAPILLILLRIMQGISAGGEWGGAVLMAVEHAPKGKRGRYGAFPQIGVPLGLLLASGVFALMSGLISPGEEFIQWGWRVPFLLSIILVFVGYWVRRSVEESPVFKEIAERQSAAKNPIGKLFKNHWHVIFIAIFVFAGINSVGYMTTGGFIQGYTTDPDGPLGMPRTQILLSVTFSAVIWIIFTYLAGYWSDFIGRRKMYLIGWVVQLAGILLLFPLVNIGTIPAVLVALSFLSIGMGLCYGQLSAFYAELFPASVRFSGVSISYAFGSIAGGAFAPFIAAWLISMTGTTLSVTIYLSLMTVVAFIASYILDDRNDIPLGPDHEAEQLVTPIRFLRNREVLKEAQTEN